MPSHGRPGWKNRRCVLPLPLFFSRLATRAPRAPLWECPGCGGSQASCPPANQPFQPYYTAAYQDGHPLEGGCHQPGSLAHGSPIHLVSLGVELTAHPALPPFSFSVGHKPGKLFLQVIHGPRTSLQAPRPPVISLQSKHTSSPCFSLKCQLAHNRHTAWASPSQPSAFRTRARARASVRSAWAYPVNQGSGQPFH